MDLETPSKTSTPDPTTEDLGFTWSSGARLQERGCGRRAPPKMGGPPRRSGPPGQWSPVPLARALVVGETLVLAVDTLTTRGLGHSFAAPAPDLARPPRPGPRWPILAPTKISRLPAPVLTFVLTRPGPR